MSMANTAVKTRGVDSSASADAAVDAARALAVRTGGTVCVSGATDHIVHADGRHACLDNGHVWMTRITGVGCSLSALIGAICAVQPDAWRACTSAMAYWGVVGQIAAARIAPNTGTGSYASALLDVASTLSQDALAATLRAEALA